MTFGLIASSSSILLIDMFVSNNDPEVVSFQTHLLSNMFLIVGAIGANLFATSICSKVQQDKAFTNEKFKYEIEVKQIK
ncbi:hypothetical protein [Aliivibrio fischeri]|uniref:hypothetical protein n=1 Tax=Aliivibrio fischeri TaxID=668 RepID=UPI0012DAF72D|nr:hypothetical protein [Aliivibrio fischeri]MUJ39419.1 hypothetical protein [Aliivibrio fischeri]